MRRNQREKKQSRSNSIVKCSTPELYSHDRVEVILADIPRVVIQIVNIKILRD